MCQFKLKEREEEIRLLRKAKQELQFRVQVTMAFTLLVWFCQALQHVFADGGRGASACTRCPGSRPPSRRRRRDATSARRYCSACCGRFSRHVTCRVVTALEIQNRGGGALEPFASRHGQINFMLCSIARCRVYGMSMMVVLQSFCVHSSRAAG